MSSNPSDSGSGRPGGLQSMLARLKGMVQAMRTPPSEEPANPAAAAAPVAPEAPAAAPEMEAEQPAEVPAATPAAPPEQPPTQADWHDVPVATPVEAPEANAEPVPVAVPVGEVPAEADLAGAAVEEGPAEEAAPAAEAAAPEEPAQAEEAPAAEEPAAEAPAPIPCPVCGTPRSGEVLSCHDCGYYFSAADLARATPAVNNGEGAAAPQPAGRLLDRFELRELIGERGGMRRYHGVDHGDGSTTPAPVVILEQDAVLPAEPVPAAGPPAALEIAPEADDEILPGFDDVVPSAGAPITEVLPSRPTWPGLAWEQNLLATLEESALPRVVASFTEGVKEYLVEEVPAGRSLWDAWDDPESDSEQRFGWLMEVAETLHHMHQCGAMLEGLRPDLVVVGDDGHARLKELGDLLPLPLPADVAVRGTLYTAPELTAGGQADARADLYSFGALLYALHVGRELSETDFDRPGNPKPFLPRFPDAHPAFGRLLTKTFRREPLSRFPTDEAGKEDPTGFLELIRTLSVLRRTLDNVRLEVASWTTTGIVRTGNEDAFAVLHACESRQDDCAESALVLLCDGMGGYEAGEVAAALTIQVLRKNLTGQPLFAHLAGASAFPDDALAPGPHADGHLGPRLDVEQAKQLIKAALREANHTVYTTSRSPGSKRRGMGCTAEVVYVDGRNLVIGHVGDSRTYHLHEGRLIQVTRDQTLVNRLVEMGRMTPEEAETSPRRNELQQAIGGQPDVEPGLYHGEMKPGDWIVVCSDGLTNHVGPNDLKHMLQSEAQSAETAARRLVNYVNIEGATDNATVVVIRAT
jgi:protein phosphatase